MQCFSHPIQLIVEPVDIRTARNPRKDDGQSWNADGQVKLHVVHGDLWSILRRSLTNAHHFTRQTFSGDVHFFFGALVDADCAVFFQVEWLSFGVIVLHCGCGEAEPVDAYAESDFFGAYFDYGVLWCVESVGGCVGAEQGSPGGPEFGVELLIDLQNS
jgi:hypothetical protein